MPEIINHQSSIANRRRGVALLMVLLIVLAVTIIGTGFLVRADTELACGGNILLRTQMDHLADSALEHARGTLLHPQDVADPYWTGDMGLQLIDSSSDYYDVTVARNASDVNDYCTFDLSCAAYRVKDGCGVGLSRLSAQLRLDPCIAFWSGGPAVFRPNWVLHGDMYSGGVVTNQAAQESVDGDLFCLGLQEERVVGQVKNANELSVLLQWPPVTSSYRHPDYPERDLSGVGTLDGYPGPTSIWWSSNDLILGNDVTIDGMLRVAGNLTIQGRGARLLAGKNLPALYVGGNLIIEDVNDFPQIEGLVVVDGDLQISAAANVTVKGALFVNGDIVETTADSSGNGNTGRVCGGALWTAGQAGGALKLDGVNDFVDCGTNTVFDLTAEITIAAWVMTEDAGNGENNPYVTKGDQAYALRHVAANAIQFDIGAGRFLQFPVDSSFNDAWKHIAATYDGSEMKLYINGQEAPTSPRSATGPIPATADPIYIGADCRTLTEFYRGAIDDVRIYNRALLQPDIATIMAGGPASAELVGHWALDEPGSRVTIIAEPMASAIVAYPNGFGIPVQWSPAVSGFFRSIGRQ